MTELLTNPTFDVDIAGWTAAAGTTIDRVTTPVHAGAGALRITSATSGGLAVTSRVTTVPGGTYGISGYVAHAGVARSMGIQIDWRTAAGAYLSSTAAASNTSTTAYALRSSTGLVAPATAERADIKLIVASTVAGEVFYFDTASFNDGVANAVPTANAGPDQAVNVGATVTLTGSGTDTDGTIASYAWTLSRPAGSAAVLSGTGATRTFTVDVAGSYLASLTVTDNLGATSPADTVTVAATARTGPHVRVAGAYVQAADPVRRVAGVYV